MEHVLLVAYIKDEVAGVLMPNSLVDSNWQVLSPSWHTLPVARTVVVGFSSRENVFSPSAEVLVMGTVCLGVLRAVKMWLGKQ